MNRLMCTNPADRLGAKGAEEVKAHAFFTDIPWDVIFEQESPFVPSPEHPEDTDYFDTRGCSHFFNQEIQDISESPALTEDSSTLSIVDSPAMKQDSIGSQAMMPLAIPPHVRDHAQRERRMSEPFDVGENDFGSFVFKNISELEKANKDVIERIKLENRSSQYLNPTAERESINIPRQRSVPTSFSADTDSPSQSFSPLLHSQAGSPIPQHSIPLLQSGRSLGHAPTSFSSLPPLQPTFMPAVRRRPSSLLPSPIKELDSSSLELGKHVARRHNTVPRQSISSVSTSSPKIASPRERSSFENSESSIFRHQRRNTMPGRARAQSLNPPPKDPVPESVMNLRAQRRSQVFDVSPSSSDNEELKSGGPLMRLRRKRARSRRLSQLSYSMGPVFRPLDVMSMILLCILFCQFRLQMLVVCEDNPVSKKVLETMLSKLGCRVVGHSDGAEAVWCALGDIQCMCLSPSLTDVNTA